MGNGKLADSMGCMERSLQPSCAKTADGSIPFGILKNSGLESSWVLLLGFYTKCDGLFWAPSQGVHHKEAFQTICCICFIIYCYKQSLESCRGSVSSILGFLLLFRLLM